MLDTEQNVPYNNIIINKSGGIYTPPKEESFMSERDEGSYGIGFLLGFILGLIGLVVALAIDKEQTKKGAIAGFITEIVVGIIAVFCVFASLGSMYR